MMLGSVLAESGHPTSVSYLLSDDLINWSEAQVVLQAPFRDEVDSCDDDDGITYPTILDPNDAEAKDWDPDADLSPNFERPTAQPDLYFNHRDVQPGRGARAVWIERPLSERTAFQPGSPRT